MSAHFQKPTYFFMPSLALAVSCAPFSPSESIGAGGDSGSTAAASSSSTTAPGTTTSTLGSTTYEAEDGTTTSSESSSGGESTSGTQGDETGVEGSTGSPTGDTTAPEVVFFQPPHGSNQVYDESITIVFSEPVNQASLEAAFPSGSGFLWSGGGTQVDFQGSFPFQEVPVVHDLVVPISVTDLAGNGLEDPFVSTIGLAALRTATLFHAVNLTGNSVDGANGNYSWFMGGDSSSNLLHHGGISFPLASLPPFGSVLAIRHARYRSHVLRMDGDPNDPGLGGHVLDHVIFATRGQIDNPTILDAGFATLFNPGDVALGETVDINVRDQLAVSWSADMDYLQLRFHAQGSNGNGVTDRLFLRRGADENDTLVPAGFVEPDPNNASRIEIEYFQ